MAAGALGEFEVIVLLGVLQAGPDAYGSRILDAIEQRAGQAPARGSVYVTLDRLERKGHLRSTLGDATAERGGRARRYYRVSPRGLARLRASLALVSRMRSGLDAVLDPA
jgi:DNA-binding PadR family transcriptional regulator